MQIRRAFIRRTSSLANGLRAHPQRILLAMVFLWALILAVYAIAKHERLNTSAYDLAIKSQVIWNTYRGRFFASSIEVDQYLGDHVQLIMLLLAPLFGLWANVNVLLIFQALMLSIGAIPLYRIANRKLGNSGLALLFSAAYLLYPTIGFVNRFDFHPVVFVIPLLLLAVDSLQTNRPLLASVFVLLALSTREEVGLTVFALGLYVVFVEKQRSLGLLWAGLGLLWSLVALFVIIPHFRGGASDTVARYAWLGDDVLEILGTLLKRPGYVIDHLFSEPFRLEFLWKLLLPVGFLPLLAPVALLVGLPTLAYNLLSETPSQSSIYFQYVSPLIPFLFLAAVLGAAKWVNWSSRRLDRRRRQLVLAGWIGLSVVVAWVMDNPFTQAVDDPFYPVYGWQRFTDRGSFDAARQLLPPEAPVATMSQFAPHLSLRPELYLFFDRIKLMEREHGFIQADYLLLDLTDLRWGVNARLFYAAIETAIGLYSYEALFFQDDVALLARDSAPQAATGAVLQRTVDLTESGGKYSPTAQTTLDWLGRQWVTPKLPPSAVRQVVPFESEITLLGYELSETALAPGRPLCVTVYWRNDARQDTSYAVFLHLVDQAGYVHAQRDSIPAFGFYPTTNWGIAETVGDMHCMQIPPQLPPGTYYLNAGIYEPESGRRLLVLEDGEPGPADFVRLQDVEMIIPGSN